MGIWDGLKKGLLPEGGSTPKKDRKWDYVRSTPGRLWAQTHIGGFPTAGHRDGFRDMLHEKAKELSTRKEGVVQMMIITPTVTADLHAWMRSYDRTQAGAPVHPFVLKNGYSVTVQYHTGDEDVIGLLHECMDQVGMSELILTHADFPYSTLSSKHSQEENFRKP